tara:strand:+ start:3231 stop:4397 length:1167 start_codon:yes stop_codon:yes gene_type:complete
MALTVAQRKARMKAKEDRANAAAKKASKAKAPKPKPKAKPNKVTKQDNLKKAKKIARNAGSPAAARSALIKAGLTSSTIGMSVAALIASFGLGGSALFDKMQGTKKKPGESQLEFIKRRQRDKKETPRLSKKDDLEIQKKISSASGRRMRSSTTPTEKKRTSSSSVDTPKNLQGLKAPTGIEKVKDKVKSSVGKARDALVDSFRPTSEAAKKAAAKRAADKRAAAKIAADKRAAAKIAADKRAAAKIAAAKRAANKRDDDKLDRLLKNKKPVNDFTVKKNRLLMPGNKRKKNNNKTPLGRTGSVKPKSKPTPPPALKKVPLIKAPEGPIKTRPKAKVDNSTYAVSQEVAKKFNLKDQKVKYSDPRFQNIYDTDTRQELREAQRYFDEN